MVEIMTARARAIHKQFMFERRLLFSCTFMVGVAIILWLVSMTTESWFTVSGGSRGIYINVTKRYFIRSQSGLFRSCRTAISNTTAGSKGSSNIPEVTATMSSFPLEVNMSDPEVLNGTKEFQKCQFHDVFPTELKILQDPTLDDTILSYTRTEIMFAIISLIVMVMGFLFSIYTFRNPRYMFKRLAGGIHLITSLSLIVVLEVFMNSIQYEKTHLPVAHPRGATYTYGYSFYLGWTVFIMNVISGICFMWYSKKRKGSKAPNDEIAMADEPTIIGR